MAGSRPSPQQNEARAREADEMILGWVLRWIAGEGVNVAREASRYAYYSARRNGATKDEARQAQQLVAVRAGQMVLPRGGSS